MDAVMTLLDVIRVNGAVYFSKIIAPPWGMAVDARPGYWRFHLVLSGSAWIETSSPSDGMHLKSGDFVIIPRGEAHVLRSGASDAVTSHNHIPGPEPVPAPVFADGRAQSGETHLLCGYFQFAQGSPLAFLKQIPNLLAVRDEGDVTPPYMPELVAIIRHELRNNRNGPFVVLNRVSEILFYCAVTHWLEREMTPGGTLSALGDVGIQRALSTIHTSPEKPWTVDELAHIAGSSRTVFSKRFRAALGFAPIEYVAYWRIEMACRLLSESGLSLDEIAGRVGYNDSNAFSRAFRRIKNVAPGAYRKAYRRHI